jgi:hypothetical protein
MTITWSLQLAKIVNEEEHEEAHFESLLFLKYCKI